jgi:hypothetical protein
MNKKERPTLAPGMKYEFEDRIKEIQITIKQCFRDVIKMGFPEKLTSYSLKNPIKERRSVQIRFSPAVSRVMYKVSKKDRVQSMIEKLQEAEKIENKIITVTPREIFVISDGGFSVLRYIMKISCNIIKEQLKIKKEKELRRIKLNKEKILHDLKEIIPEWQKFKIVSVSHKKERNSYFLKLITENSNSMLEISERNSAKLIDAIKGMQCIIKKMLE